MIKLLLLVMYSRCPQMQSFTALMGAQMSGSHIMQTLIQAFVSEMKVLLESRKASLSAEFLSLIITGKKFS